MENKIKCAKCSSEQLSANKKGFSGSKALGGAILTGGIGVLAGTIGSSNVRITCLSCGHVFKPGEDKESVIKKNQQLREMRKDKGFIRFVLVLLAVMVLLVATCL
jgi:hypothetical protein